MRRQCHAVHDDEPGLTVSHHNSKSNFSDISFRLSQSEEVSFSTHTRLEGPTDFQPGHFQSRRPFRWVVAALSAHNKKDATNKLNILHQFPRYSTNSDDGERTAKGPAGASSAADGTVKPPSSPSPPSPSPSASSPSANSVN